MSLIEKLSKIQREMKAPKNLYNSFGNYKYRNAEGILEAFKPFEEKYDVALILSDDIDLIGDRTYVRATATLYDLDDGSAIFSSASAREQDSKKGMDEAQVTGAVSSYARKYALNGLFLLDDTKDPDTDEARKESDARSERDKVASQKINRTKAAALMKAIADKGVPIQTIFDQYGVQKLEELTEEQFLSITRRLDKSGGKA